MNSLAYRIFAAWFNDGKRISALVLTGLGLLSLVLRGWGLPLPEGAEATIAPIIGGWIFTLLSKLDVRVPTAPKTP